MKIDLILYICLGIFIVSGACKSTCGWALIFPKFGIFRAEVPDTKRVIQDTIF
jgi:hypothetical protein